ncbi:myristylated tegument protein [Falconid herpesvirus 1]|uniref:Cytoplasmic envelopment protein 3 n=2 Tax=Columbid alphaherpesvirus 1 TaxID=93386 RepID=A0A068EP49_9ALPH|nr:myristylated tegument protein [Falconid herpesvirus 1]YP_009352915.1 myristylated tegument protein [Columbid alphaherpesvirus 1]AID52711.1 myristylated tegument protein [Falconid herpesvirus 1]ARD71332.1 myristylated tegument protein [Columbid alphaherpesvirus 1]
MGQCCSSIAKPFDCCRRNKLVTGSGDVVVLDAEDFEEFDLQDVRLSLCDSETVSLTSSKRSSPRTPLWKPKRSKQTL